MYDATLDANHAFVREKTALGEIADFTERADYDPENKPAIDAVFLRRLLLGLEGDGHVLMPGVRMRGARDGRRLAIEPFCSKRNTEASLRKLRHVEIGRRRKRARDCDRHAVVDADFHACLCTSSPCHRGVRKPSAPGRRGFAGEAEDAAHVQRLRELQRHKGRIQIYRQE
jgi:hypothetical protein